MPPKPENYRTADAPGPQYEKDYSGHYLHSTPSPVPVIAGLLMALGLLAFGISEFRTAAVQRSSLQIAPSGSEITEGAAVLQVTAESWRLDGQSVTENDLLFRLTGAAGRSPIVIVEHAPGISATRLTRALEMVNQAGFTQVGVRALESTPAHRVD